MPARVTYAKAARRATLKPTASLQGGPNGAKDAGGTSLTEDEI